MCHNLFRRAAPSLDQETLKSCRQLFGAAVSLSFFSQQTNNSSPRKPNQRNICGTKGDLKFITQTTRQGIHIFNRKTILMMLLELLLDQLQDIIMTRK